MTIKARIIALVRRAARFLMQPEQSGQVEALRRDRKACWEEFKALRRSSDATERELRAEVEALRALLADARELIEHGDFREGHCMCGSAVEGHTFGDGHAPCDAGEYYAGQVRERIDAALDEKLEKATVALKTIGSGRPDGINVSEAPVGHARPATPPHCPPNEPTRPCPQCGGPADSGNCPYCIPY